MFHVNENPFLKGALSANWYIIFLSYCRSTVPTVVFSISNVLHFQCTANSVCTALFSLYHSRPRHSKLWKLQNNLKLKAIYIINNIYIIFPKTVSEDYVTEIFCVFVYFRCYFLHKYSETNVWKLSLCNCWYMLLSK